MLRSDMELFTFQISRCDLVSIPHSTQKNTFQSWAACIAPEQ